MVNFYVWKIQNGDMTVDDVPNLWKTKVQAELDKLSQATA